MSRGATARLFVAVDPPPAVSEELARWARAAAASLGPREGGPAPQLRLLEPQLLHLTLCFLGARPVGEIDALAAALQGCAGHACELSLGAPLWLPPRRPRALAVAVHDPAGELERLQAHVSSALAGVSGWEPDRRRFRAHITLARMRAARRSRRGEESGAALLPPTPQLHFMPESLGLYRSWLTSAGASYELIFGCALLPAGA